MRKTIIPAAADAATPSDSEWLDLESLARVEVTSEDDGFPVESALVPGDGPGWRAGGPGAQTLRLLFDAPQAIRRIRLRFEEAGAARTQEFVLRWSGDGGGSFREIVRQQWNFSPQGATSETEEYSVELSGVRVLELTVTPDINGGVARASVAELRLG